MTDWKAESRKWERRAKANARALDAALDQLETDDDMENHDD